MLAANNTPDFRTISDFRKDNLAELSDLFLQVLALCQLAGLVKLGHVALDGTKVKANASKHKAMSYGRMQEMLAQLAAEVAELLRKAQEADEAEDRRYGQDKRGDELPAELAFREGRLEKIREAMAALEAEAQAAAEGEGSALSGIPDDKAQRNFTDAESRIMPGPGGRDFVQAYNCQAVVDSDHQVIVAAQATNQASDKQQAVAMIEETIANTGAVPREVSADAGYYSAKAVDELYALGTDPYVAPEKTRHGRVLPPAPKGRIPNHLSPRDRMRRKLLTKKGRERYALRMATVEPVFGQIKQGRGFRQFLLRGLEKVKGEWLLICTGHNLLKLFRFGARLPAQGRVASSSVPNFAVEMGEVYTFSLAPDVRTLLAERFPEHCYMPAGASRERTQPEPTSAPTLVPATLEGRYHARGEALQAARTDQHRRGDNSWWGDGRSSVFPDLPLPADEPQSDHLTCAQAEALEMATFPHDLADLAAWHRRADAARIASEWERRHAKAIWDDIRAVTWLRAEEFTDWCGGQMRQRGG